MLYNPGTLPTHALSPAYTFGLGRSAERKLLWRTCTIRVGNGGRGWGVISPRSYQAPTPDARPGACVPRSQAAEGRYMPSLKTLFLLTHGDTATARDRSRLVVVGVWGSSGPQSGNPCRVPDRQRNSGGPRSGGSAPCGPQLHLLRHALPSPQPQGWSQQESAGGRVCPSGIVSDSCFRGSRSRPTSPHMIRERVMDGRLGEGLARGTHGEERAPARGSS